MAKIVLGIATAHTPLLTLNGDQWHNRAAADMANTRLNMSDGRWLTYPQLLAEVGPKYESVVTPEVLIGKSQQCEAALDRLADALQEAAPDVVIIIGDDQSELFGPANQPAFAVYHGDEIVMLDKVDEETPQWMRTVRHGYLMDDAHKVPGAPDFALELIEGLMDRHVDVAVSDRVENPEQAAFGHAYGFIVKRLFRGRPIPVVPVLLNTYFPPNVPTAARCFDVGQAIRDVVQASPSDLRVAIVASGGLSHFVVDEPLDRGVIEAIQTQDAQALRAIPRCALNSGSSEILNWVMTAGALHGTAVQMAEYYPLQHTPAGTGVGAGFVVWREA